MTDTRTVPVELLRQALEALGKWSTGLDMNGVELNDLIATLEAALEQQEQEPVAWIQPDHLQKARQAPFLCRVEPTKRMSDFVPIYTTPPRREWRGLSVDEIDRIAKQEWGEDHEIFWFDDDGIALFARALETALKEKNT